MKIGVIGTGHVGLVTCVSMAALGHEVVGNDSDQEKIYLLEKGSSPFFEPGLDALLSESLDSGRLRFSIDLAPAVEGADVVFICVGTPPRASGEANLAAVETAARDVALLASGPTLIVEKSTVPAGTSKRLKTLLARARPDLVDDLHVASNPEFLREGSGVHDSLHPERILVGADSPWAFEKMRDVYRTQIDAGSRLIETDIATAELAKHACNAYLAMKISYVNALARLCERSGGDVVAVAEVMGSDPRIGPAFLDAGIGYGGYCFPKDVQAFERLAAQMGYDFGLLREVARINDEAVDAIVTTVVEALWNPEAKKVALLGLAFKPGTDDVRCAPALALAKKLLDRGADVVGYDPEAGANAKAELPGLQIAPDPYEAVTGAQCIVVCTEWPEFLSLDLERVKELAAHPVLVDGRNIFDPELMRAAGFTYHPTGRS